MPAPWMQRVPIFEHLAIWSSDAGGTSAQTSTVYSMASSSPGLVAGPRPRCVHYYGLVPVGLGWQPSRAVLYGSHSIISSLSSLFYKSWVVPAITAVGVVTHASRFRDPGYGIDDAWISFRIARNWVRGDGLTFNPGEAPVEGMTNLLWTILSGGWIAVFPSQSPMVWARGVGLALLLTSAWITVSLIGRIAIRMGARPWPSQAVAGAMIVASGSTIYHALSGLETSLWSALFVASLACGLRGYEGRVWGVWACGLLLGALAMTRPEGVLVGGLLCAAAIQSVGRRSWPMILMFAVAVVGLEWFRWAYYGALVPNTFHAKPPDAMAGLQYGWSFLCYGLGGVGLLSLVAVWKHHPWTRWFVCLTLILGAGTVWSGGDWMAGHRRFTLVTWLMVMGSGIAVAASSSRRAGLMGAAGCIVGSLMSAVLHPQAGLTEPRVLQTLAERSQAEGLRSVGLVDIGLFGWIFEGAIYDMVGLTDRHIASQDGVLNEKEWDEQYFRSHSPALILVRSQTPVTDPLQAMPVIGHPDDKVLLSILDHGGYYLRTTASFGPERHILAFARNDVVLSESRWGAAAPKDLRQLIIEYQDSR